MPKILEKGESAVSLEGKYWKFCYCFPDGSGFFYSQGFDCEEEALLAMNDFRLKKGDYTWRT